MNAGALWDVWLLGFELGADPIRGLVGLFGMTEAAAQNIEMTVPRAMKRGLSGPEAEKLLAALVQIGAKAELREHRMESARRSMSRPQMEAVRPAPAVVSSAPPRPAPDPSPPVPTPVAPASIPAAQGQRPNEPASGAHSMTPSEVPLGAPVAGELSKTPRNVMMAITFVVLLLVVIAGLASLVGDGDDTESFDEGTPDAEAVALLEGPSHDARAYMNNPRATFSGADPDAMTAFINGCYADGAPRVIIADLNMVGSVSFAKTILVELPDDDDVRTAIRDNYAETFLHAPAWAGDEDPPGFGSRWFVVRID